MDAMTKAKLKYGHDYHVAGGDGVHPDANGQLVMAYAFLKALGFDGEIGKITVDLSSNQANATSGHKVLSCANGTVELESSRYPFCFSGDPKATSATSGIIEFMPFNDDVNRFTLVVEHAPADKCRVTWGASSKEFTREQLATGINLAAEFIENPFCEPFRKVEAVVRTQQNYETPLVKSLLTKVPEFKQLVPQEAATIEQVAAGGMRKDQQLFALVAATVTPVKHTLMIEGLK
jgi:hypothetical protein